MLQKASTDQEVLHAHDFQNRPPLPLIVENSDANARDSEGGVSQNMGDAVHGSLGTMPASAVGINNPMAQSTPSGGSAPVHLTAFLNPEALRSSQSPSIGRPSEAPVHRDGGLGVATNLAPANLATAATAATAIGDSESGGEARSSAGEPRTDRDAGQSLLPHAAGLISEVIRFDRASLEGAVDQFFEQLEDLGAGPLTEPGSLRALPLSLTVIGAVAGAEITRRRLRAKGGASHDTRRRDPLGSEDLLGFPELPGSWSTRLT